MSERAMRLATRSGVVRAALLIGITSGAYAISFGAIGTAAGLTVVQTCVLSLVMFTGASQFAMAGVLGGGGGAAAAVSTAIALSARNMFYGLRITTILRARGWRRLVAAQLVIDESTAMSLMGDADALNRLGFWSTGVSVYVFWNLGTLLGALGAHALASPRTLGLDAAAPAALLALLAPRLRARQPGAVAVVAAVVALACVPLLPQGTPVLLGGLIALGVGARARRRPAVEEEPA